MTERRKKGSGLFFERQEKESRPLFGASELRDAIRGLRRAPGFTLVVVLLLALGTGVNTAIFTVLDALLFKALPYADADRVVRVAEWPRTGGNFTVAPAAFVDWRDRTRAFSALEARVFRSFTLVGDNETEQLGGARVTPGYFDLLGIRPTHGRSFVADDAIDGAPCAVIISARLWSRRLGADPNAVGAPMRFADGPCTVLGVLPADTVFDRLPYDVYQPLVLGPAAATQQGRLLTAYARLAPDVTIDAARAEIVQIAETFNATRGPAGRGWTASVTPLRETIVRPVTRQLVWVLFGAVAVVLLVACVNVAGMALTRTTQRRRELAVRMALGAGRARVFALLFTESVLLGLAGSALGLAVGQWTLRVFNALIPPALLPPEAIASLDLRTVAFTTVLALVTAILFGTIPAWRGAAPDMTAALRSGPRTMSASRGTTRLHHALVVAEIAMATILVVGGALLLVSFSRLTSVNPGFDADAVLTMRLDVPSARYATESAAAALYAQTMDAIERIPGVAAAGAATSLPLGGWRYGTTFVIDGVAADPERPTSAHIQHVAGRYFDALGIRVAAGRAFAAADDARAPLVAIVNETFVARFLNGTAAVGRHVKLGIDLDSSGAGPTRAIVGVVRDVKTGGLGDSALATPEIYVPSAQNPAPSMFVAIRASSGTPMALLPAVRSAIRNIDPHLAPADPMTMDERIGASVRMQRFQTTTIAALGVLGTLVATIGVYAVRAHTVRAKLKELGIRVALGASRSMVLRLVMGETAVLVGIGLVLGAAAAAWLTSFVEGWLFATNATDPIIFVLAAVALGAAALLAAWLPARRAARVDPMTTLRQD